MSDCPTMRAGLCQAREINRFTDSEMNIMKSAEARGNAAGRKAALLEAAGLIRAAAQCEGKTTARIFEKAAKLVEKWAANGKVTP